MNINFIVNDYVLVWNLLFGASISNSIHQLKQKIWDTYRREYNELFHDKSSIIKDYKNYIPNNDTIYNIVMQSRDYDKIRKQVEKYRIEVMQLWDQHKKENEYLMKKVIRKNISNYTVFVVSKELGIMENVSCDQIIMGIDIDKKNSLKYLMSLYMEIVKSHVKKYRDEKEDFKKVILELAIINEYATQITGKSCYQYGDPSLQSIKRQIYPYWLMYLGIPKEELFTYMMRDKIEFDPEKIAYEKELKRMDIEEFIDFCVRNKRYIIRDRVEVEEIL